MRAEGVPASAEGAANVYAASLDMLVHGDALTVTAHKDKQSGRFKILKEYATSLTIATDRDGMERAPHVRLR